MSPLALAPLPALGFWAARKVHGDLRSSEGYLLTSRHFIERDQEWRLGQAYLGLLGLPLFVLIAAYLGIRGEEGHWSDLSLDARILYPLAFLSHITGFASVIRLHLLRGQLGLREDLGE
jgi:hypothetical protein